jgi:GTP cyclohydrolase II
MQAPRSERIQKENGKLGESSAMAKSSSSGKPKRRMSMDPAPISQILQAANPSHNYFTSPSPQSKLPPSQPLVRCMARTRIPTPHGELFLHLYHNSSDNKEHLAIVIDPIQLSPDALAAAPKGRREIRSRSLNEKWREGETDMERVVRGAYVGRLSSGGEGQASVPSTDKPGRIAEDAEEDILPLVRIHSECFTGETIGSMRCDCGEQLDEAMRLIARPHSTSQSTIPGRGVVIYMRQEGRGIGLLEKIRAYNLQDLGMSHILAKLMIRSRYSHCKSHARTRSR